MGTLWYGGNIYTMQRPEHKVEAVYTEGEKIIAVGSKFDLETSFRKMIERKVDLEGATMFPGFVDSHMHLIGHGERQLKLDLTGLLKEEILDRIREESKRVGSDEWIIGEGWDENLWEDKTPITKFDIDQVVSHQPVLLKRVCRHAATVNSKALQLAGISSNIGDIPGGKIEKNEQGELTGVLKDSAQQLLNEVLPKIDETYLKNALTAGIESCYRYGLTGAHTEDLSYYIGFHDTYRTFKKVIEEEMKWFRAHLLVHHHVIDDWQKAGYRYKDGSKFIEFGAMKIFADGSLGGRTALLSFPYADDPTTNGVAIHSYERLQELILKARSLQLPVAIHAIGDLAFEWVLDIIEKFPPPDGTRDRLIHAVLLRKELMKRARKLPVVLDIQPVFLISDYPWVLDRVGVGNIEFMYAWKTLLTEGFHCSGGSDAPIEEVNPLLGIHAAVNRTIPNSKENQIFDSHERLSVFEAISLFTKGSAFAAGQEHERGLIKEGYLADFSIFNHDLFKIGVDQILDTKAVKTVIGGKVVWSNYE